MNGEEYTSACRENASKVTQEIEVLRSLVQPGNRDYSSFWTRVRAANDMLNTLRPISGEDRQSLRQEINTLCQSVKSQMPQKKTGGLTQGSNAEKRQRLQEALARKRSQIERKRERIRYIREDNLAKLIRPGMSRADDKKADYFQDMCDRLISEIESLEEDIADIKAKLAKLP